MLSRRSAPALAGIAATLAALLMPSLARAADNKIIDGTDSFAGDRTYDTFTITKNGKLTVLPLTMGGGKLTISANRIVIEAMGELDADGAGYVGQDGAAGQAPSADGGGQMSSILNQPGGGGAFAGAGAPGLLSDCSTQGGAGGVAFYASGTPSFGAAGGAAHLSSPTATAGGAGGGIIVLQAGEIVIDGLVSARGKSLPPAIGGTGRGGGAGGTIVITTGTLSGTGTLNVHGGDGSQSSATNASNGGGGGGGVIIFNVGALTTAPGNLSTDVLGGQSGKCVAAGGAGKFEVLPLDHDCVDLDKDGHYSSHCGGDDCDDTNADIHPGAPEVCNGQDDNCNGLKDDPNDGGPLLCVPGSECVDGVCHEIPGSDAGTDAGASCADGGGKGCPEHIEFTGGCSLPQAGGLAEGAGAAAAFAAGVMALAASRRSRRSRRRR